MLPKYQAQRRALMKQGEPPADPRLQRRPAPPPNATASAFRPQIRGSLLDALQRMAEQSGRDPNELLDELISTATSSEAPPSMASEVESAPEQDLVGVGETMDTARRRQAGDDAASASEETDCAPPDKMKGSKPNPLLRWAQGESTNGEEPTNDPKKAEEDERERRRQKYLAPAGKAQGRG